MPVPCVVGVLVLLSGFACFHSLEDFVKYKGYWVSNHRLLTMGRRVGVASPLLYRNSLYVKFVLCYVWFFKSKHYSATAIDLEICTKYGPKVMSYDQKMYTQLDLFI